MAEGGRSGLGFLLVLWSLGRTAVSILSSAVVSLSQRSFLEVHRYTINDPRFARQTVSSPLRLGQKKGTPEGASALKSHQVLACCGFKEEYWVMEPCNCIFFVGR